MDTEQAVLDDTPAMNIDLSGETPRKEEVDPQVRRDDPLEELKQQLAAEKRAREQAEQRLRSAAEEQAVERISVARGRMVSEMNEARAHAEMLKTRQEDLQRQYREALEQGDFETVAKTQSDMALLAVDLRAADTHARRIDAELRRGAPPPRQAPPPQQPVPVTPDDKLNAVLQRVTPATAEWFKRNPDYAIDERKNKLAIAAHHKAIALGLEAESADYFRLVEKELGIGEQPAQPPQRREREAPPPAAPVHRDVDHARGNLNAGSVTLTRAEVELCQLNDIDPEEYARQKLKAMQAGEIGRGR